MTRSEAIAIITGKLEAADDATLEAVASRMAGADHPTTGDILDALPNAGLLPRALTARAPRPCRAVKRGFPTWSHQHAGAIPRLG